MTETSNQSGHSSKSGRHCLYSGEVYHHRNYPKDHAFRYKIFMFYLNVNEIPSLSNNILISKNRFNLFSFYDQDYLPELAEKIGGSGSNLLFDRINFFLQSKNIILKQPQFFLLTHLRFLGYVFNPVVFYYCYNGKIPVGVVVEVQNTFKERKIYFVEQVDKIKKVQKEHDELDHHEPIWFTSKQYKDFYVSPFSHPHTHFNFKLREAGERIKVIVNERDDERMYFHSYFAGEHQHLTTFVLLKAVLWFIPVTFKVTIGIHWQAFKLWLRRVPYYGKQEHTEHQKHFYRK